MDLPYGENLPDMPYYKDYQVKGPIEILSNDIAFGLRPKSLYELPKDNEGVFTKRQFRADIAEGSRFEQLFQTKMEAQGFKVYEVPFWSYNYKKHIDFEIEDSNGQCAFVDIKTPRSLRKSKATQMGQNRYIVVELMPYGSLFGSHSDYIAFGQTDDTFLVCSRPKLDAMVKSRMPNFRVRSAWPETALNVPYVRSYEGRNSSMMYLDIEDLYEQNVILWKIV